MLYWNYIFICYLAKFRPITVLFNYFIILGDCVVTLKHSVQNSCEWARLENKEKITVSDYIDRIEGLDDKSQLDRNASPGYLFDWSLPIHCPRLVEKIRIPRYFAGKTTMSVKKKLLLLFHKILLKIFFAKVIVIQIHVQFILNSKYNWI